MLKHPHDRSSRPANPFSRKRKCMIKTFSGALSLALTILILRLTLPEVGRVAVEIVMKALLIISKLLDSLSSLPIQ